MYDEKQCCDEQLHLGRRHGNLENVRDIILSLKSTVQNFIRL